MTYTLEDFGEDLELAKTLLPALKGYRVLKKEVEDDMAEAQEVLVAALVRLDAQKRGVVFGFEGEALCGTVSRPEASPRYDTAQLVAYLRAHNLYDSVCTTVVDPLKLAAEVNSGNIDPKDLAMFALPPEPIKPYILFTKPKEGSL